MLKYCEVSRILISNWTWKFQLSILKNKKVFFTAKKHPKDGVSRLNFPEGFAQMFQTTYIIWWNNYDWKYLTKFQKFVVPWSQVTKPFSSHSLFLLKLRNLTKYLRFFPRLGFFVQSQKLNKMKNLSNWEFFLHPNRCTQFSASKLSTLQIANRWRCYHHYVLSCAPSSAKSTKPSLCAYWVNRS